MVLDGFEHPVTASHCVSLGMQELHRQQEIAELVARAGIDVVALPHTNLYPPRSRMRRRCHAV